MRIQLLSINIFDRTRWRLKSFDLASELDLFGGLFYLVAFVTVVEAMLFDWLDYFTVPCI